MLALFKIAGGKASKRCRQSIALPPAKGKRAATSSWKTCRYRIHAKSLPGTPDLAIVGLRTCIFINGCFWHGHEGCSMYKIPQTHVEFWSHKIQRNKERDHENLLALKTQGWHTIEIWECQLKPQEREQTLQGLLCTLNYIALQNQGAKMTYDFDVEEERSIAAEEE